MNSNFQPDPSFASLAPEDITMRGPPPIGALAALNNGADYQKYIEGPSGRQEMLYQLDMAQTQKLRDAGVAVSDPIGSELDKSTYTEFQDATFERDQFVALGTQEGTVKANAAAVKAAKVVEKRNAELIKLREKHPELGIKDYEAMNSEVIARGQDIIKKVNAPHTFAGNVAHYAGSFLGSLDPSTNKTGPLNLVGMGGKTALMRIMGQMGFGAATTAFDEMTGTTANERFFGLNPSTGDVLTKVAVAGALGGVIQGVGEAGGALVRSFIGRGRIKALTPTPAPVPAAVSVAEAAVPPPPVPHPGLSGADAVLARFPDRMSKVAMSRKLDAVDRQLNENWGATPAELRPPEPLSMDTAGAAVDIRAGNDAIGMELPASWRAAAQPSLEDAARLTDKTGVFRKMDNLMTELKRERDQISIARRLNQERAAGRSELLNEIIATKQTALDAARSPKVKARLATEIQQLYDQARTKVPFDTKPTKVADVVARIEAHKPLVKDALATAQGSWALTKEQAAQVDEAVIRGIGDAPSGKPAGSVMEGTATVGSLLGARAKRTSKTLDLKAIERANPEPRVSAFRSGENVPEMTSPDAPPRVAGKPMVDTVDAVQKVQTDKIEKELEAYQAHAIKQLGDEAKGVPTELHGEATVIRGDKIAGMDPTDPDRQMTIQEAREAILEDKEVFSAVTSCGAP